MTAVFEAALRYVQNGYSIVPCVGKKASVPWTNLCQRTPTTAQVNRWHNAGLLENVAIIGGAVSGNLVIVDLDGDEAVGRFTDAFPSLMDTYTVISGSGHGAHLYLRASILPRSKRTTGLEWGNVELRADGCYVVAPPSIHPNTNRPYIVSNRVPIKRVTSLVLLANWIDAQNASKRTAPTHSTERPAIDSSKWALAALEAESAAVRTAPAGARNHTLNRAAYKLGQLVGAGRLNRGEVETVLLAAADSLSRDDGETTVVRTIRSGLNAGIANPRG